MIIPIGDLIYQGVQELFIYFYVTIKFLLTPSSSGNKGDILTNVFLLLNRYFGKIGVYLFLGGLFLCFFVSAIRKIWRSNHDD